MLNLYKRKVRRHTATDTIKKLCRTHLKARKTCKLKTNSLKQLTTEIPIKEIKLCNKPQ
jgi:hypothetical protein